ncbi:hypothetical protein AXG93_891s1170 [Marchantia polymorpha subsp. ruderalis]|uniref:Uncharacterized protein n=1 Tax=Marchantia polymorpha subsp. ruderalis TaxID=1480154 RepID=A0A176VK86_MARPO|nr:hypothetical protein AXG93_891s1170 [Marchantia polymorpha subsp. ruderalis]
MFVPMSPTTLEMSKGILSYDSMLWSTCFDKGIVPSSAKSFWTSALAASVLQKKSLQQRMFGKVKDGVERESNSNTCTVNSQEFTMPLRGMGLLTAAEQKQFLLETETPDDEEALGWNEVANEEDYIALALPSAKVDKSENAVKERPKKRKLQRVTTSELIDQLADLQIRRPITTKMRSANVHARSKMKARRL